MQARRIYTWPGMYRYLDECSVVWYRRRNSLVSTVTLRLLFYSWQVYRCFPFVTMSIPSLGLTQSRIQYVPEYISQRIKWQERESDSSTDRSSEV